MIAAIFTVWDTEGVPLLLIAHPGDVITLSTGMGEPLHIQEAANPRLYAGLLALRDAMADVIALTPREVLDEMRGAE